MAANDEIQDKAIRHSVYLEGYKKNTVFKMIALLNRADDDLIEQIRKRLEKIEAKGFDQGPATTKRLAGLIANLRKTNAKAYAAVTKALREELQSFVKYEAGWQTALLAGAEVAQVGVAKPDLRGLFAVVTARPFQGRFLKDWLTDLETDRARRIRDAIRIGMVEGQTTEQIVRRIKGTQARQYDDGIISIDRRHLRAVVNTAIAHTANVARQKTAEANQDILKGVKWSSTLDSRTTLICISRDGRMFPPLTGPRPPAHWNCRSSMVPVTKSWQELGIDLDEAPPGTRASMNGQVPADMTYGEWLKRQPVDIQNEVLGEKRAALFRKGGLGMDKFVSRTGDELTLDQLRARHPDVWERAGL